jgi:hypothetical protein
VVQVKTSGGGDVRLSQLGGVGEVARAPPAFQSAAIKNEKIKPTSVVATEAFIFFGLLETLSREREE